MKATLRMILKCSDVMYYDVIQYNLTFLNFKSCILTFEGLQAFCDEIKSSDRDFNIEAGMLKCNPVLREVSIDEKTLKTLIECDELESTSEMKGGSLYNLLDYCLTNKCLIVDDDKEDWNNSFGVTFFRNVHFSSSTMTIYARMYNADGLYNKMIVTMDNNNGRLVFKPFTIAAPEGISLQFCCESLNESVILNNVKYTLWRTDYLSICDLVPLADGVINQAALYAVRYTDGMNICMDYLKSVTDRLDDTTVSWGGGDGSYAFKYGVYIKSSAVALSRKTRMILLKNAEKLVKSRGSVDETSYAAQSEFAQLLLNECGTENNALKFGASVTAKIFYNSKNMAERVAIASSLLHQFTMMTFYTKMYLYKVRTYSYLQHCSLVKASAPQIVGGNTKEFAKVSTYFN